MMAFLDSTTDQYAILQLRRSRIRYMNAFRLCANWNGWGWNRILTIMRWFIRLRFFPTRIKNTMLEELYAKFNVSALMIYCHSLSVSDIVVYGRMVL